MHGGEIMNFQISLLQIVSGGSGFVGSGDLGYFGMVRNIASHPFTSLTFESLILPFFLSFCFCCDRRFTARLELPSHSTGWACAGAIMRGRSRTFWLMASLQPRSACNTYWAVRAIWEVSK